uniref:Uncharacterized protein n=3 Tax=Nitrobacteraceae TaxID=41294 RepID=A0AAJ5NN28_9BRAD|nr:hypothetical protein [Rhodoplanes serenus]VCU06556.1 hypothetical protein RHODPL_RHODPL_00004 [Rhodoplanes serenus]
MGRPAASSVRMRVDPRDIPPEKAARRLHLTPDRFRELLPALRRRGFPAADPTTGNYDLKAIDAWMDRRSRLDDLTSPEGLVNDRASIRERIARL